MKTIDKKISVEDFVRQSFCVDGDVTIVDIPIRIVTKAIKCVDSKRGTFYVTWWDEK